VQVFGCISGLVLILTIQVIRVVWEGSSSICICICCICNRVFKFVYLDSDADVGFNVVIEQKGNEVLRLVAFVAHVEVERVQGVEHAGADVGETVFGLGLLFGLGGLLQSARGTEGGQPIDVDRSADLAELPARVHDAFAQSLAAFLVAVLEVVFEVVQLLVELVQTICES